MRCDLKALPLKLNPAAMCDSLDVVGQISANGAPLVTQLSEDAGLARWLEHRACSESGVGSCRQKIWLSFFFDGTGNNIDADMGWLKHSSVARLYRVHSGNDEDAGVYRIYIPGVGTYFKEIGDDGGGVLGLGVGYKGEDRLLWALSELDKKLKIHTALITSTSNKIEEVNISVFGFSRGAALARAFINMIVDQRCEIRDSQAFVCNGGYRLRIRFMGLFDTVASVGRPMSSNTTSKIGTATSDIASIIKSRLGDSAARPNTLAFQKGGAAGADPAPGRANGHDSWGAAMRIPEIVEEVRHFIAAHEIRNSFPVDSVSSLAGGRITKPSHFYETVYPGVHSDIGASYRPGEGARSDENSERLGLIPLRHMYEHAAARGVPLLPESNWKSFNKKDFEISQDLTKVYNGYMSMLANHSSLGELLNSHMRVYFGWRFRTIALKMKGDRTEAHHIFRNNQVFKKERQELVAKVKILRQVNTDAWSKVDRIERRKVKFINENYGSLNFKADSAALNEELKVAKEAQSQAQDNMLKTKAKLDALPNMDNLEAMLEMYDAQLLHDARSIYELYGLNGKTGAGKREQLRPHYKALMTAYESEFILGKGLTDSFAIGLFDKFVHDSLSAFAKDATLPSDPRVVFLGENQKYQYASNGYMDSWSESENYA